MTHASLRFRISTRTRVETKRRCDIAARREQRGNHSEHQNGDAGDGERDQYGVAVDANRVESRQLRRRERDERFDEPCRKRESEHPARECQHSAFDEQLSNHIAVRRTERSTNRDLPRAC
jgi:hypothetical protein